MGSSETSVWQVEVPPDAPEVPHQMTREEILVVLEGVARATVDDEVADVRPGGTIVVPAGSTFSLTAAGPQPVVAMACLPVGGQACMPGEEPFTPPWAI
jgi:mannose-6-phosphate isomerase-like protein (cupin superfamily)